jgi:hypothetical protein
MAKRYERYRRDLKEKKETRRRNPKEIRECFNSENEKLAFIIVGLRKERE